MIRKPTNKQIIGKIGEDSTCKYLKNKGFKILDRNYLKKWGEIDIVSKKDGVLHFIEVKSVTREITDTKVSHETSYYRAEDNMHAYKSLRLRRVIETYILEKDLEDVDFVCDLAVVHLDMSKRIARVSFIEDIVF